jgi:hypothetical protein
VYAVTLALGAAIGAALLFGLARAYRTLASVELVVLWWWAAIAILVLGGVAGPTYLLIGLAGVLMVGLGLFVAFDVRGIAERLARRRMGIGPVWTQRSAAHWRITGAGVAVIGAFWTLAFGSAF